MKTAICYYSTHHGNTLQVARAMTQGYDVDFFDLSTQREAALADYDLVGFASGIYGFAFHPSVVAFARKYLPHLWDCQRDRRQGNHQGIPGEERKDTGGI